LTLDTFCDQIFVYDEKAGHRCQKLGIPRKKIKVSGWFVQNAFYQIYDRKLILKKLQLKENIFTLLVCGGSEGTNAILKVIPTLLTTDFPLQVIIVCGSNKVLYHSLRLLRQTGKILSQDHLNIKLFQSTNIMPELIAASDLVMGKAGPNLLFETIAGRKPFFAICHISGQEDGNLELIKQKNLGLVEENPFRAGTILEKIIRRPQILWQFQKSIEKERLYNLHAAEVLLSTLNSSPE
jgi:UDP-N-acetylglucosamine:LPS N-acetylglucosamine transferase